MKEEVRLAARKKDGLDQKNSDIKDIYSDPTTAYVPKPYAKTKTEWLEKIKEEKVIYPLYVNSWKNYQSLDKTSM